MNHPTDSQLTLVDTHSPVPEENENMILIFDKDNMCNTTLRIRDNHLPSYLVATRDGSTTVYAGDILLATVTRRLFRRDQIAFPGLGPMHLGNWLKAPIFSTLPLVFRACGQRFEWRRDRLGQLALRKSDHPDEIVAWFSKSHAGHEDRVMNPAYLAIKPEVTEMRDMIVLSCLLAEFKLRILDAISASETKVAMYSMML